MTLTKLAIGDVGLAVAITVCVSLSGCSIFSAGSLWESGGGLAAWSASSDADGETSNQRHSAQHSSLKLTQQSRQTMSLEVDFRHVPVTALGKELWRGVDETVFSAEVRKAWLDNGIRIGLVSATGDPFELTNAESDGDGDPTNQLLARADVLGNHSEGREIVPLHPSRRHELPLSRSLEGSQVVLFRRTSGLMGQSVQSPQLLLALTAVRGPREGQATLQIRPEIQHGAVKQQFVSSETAVRIHAGREQWKLPELDLSWIAKPDTRLLLAPALQQNGDESVVGQPTFGLGRQMLRDDQHVEDDQCIVTLLRLN
ncbi:hypothetical protein [Neorhodopirellula lusitana]|uniref:hypothetical protein n=1 Tax=Neorhodopirellula lusitana TaxID=445327 RepID=UPI00384D488E